MQVRAAYTASIRIIRGGKKKTHSSAFDKFEIFVFKKTPRFMRALLFRYLLGFPPQPILTPNYTTLGKVKRGNCANRAVPSLMFSRASLRFFYA